MNYFKENSLFRGMHENYKYNACVGFNGGPYDLYDYAHGYFKASFLIFEGAKQPGAIVDTIVYPACYNFRHAMELSVKYLAERCAKLSGEEKSYRFGHNLRDNWKLVLEMASAIRTTIFQTEELDIVDQTIREFCEVDPVGQIFRYPESIK
jgi:hypothetical protein